MMEILKIPTVAILLCITDRHQTKAILEVGSNS